MPWRATCIMDERVQFIGAYLCGEMPLAVLCRAHGISRKTGYKWVERYEQEGSTALADRKRAPNRHPNATEKSVERQIVRVRKKHPTWGPKKLRVVLEQEATETIWPAVSTFGEILKRHGLVKPRRVRRHTPPFEQPFADSTEPNVVWCMDFKGDFELGDRTRCYPLTVTDAHSRYLLRCQALRNTRTVLSKPVLESAFREFGLPERMRSDNGTPFASRGVGGLSELSVWLVKLGIVLERIVPGNPQQNGRHERMHRTLKAETTCPPKHDMRAQQRAFHRFQKEYNDARPHEALEQTPPAAHYTPSRRVFPRKVEDPFYDGTSSVRRVGEGGHFKWKGQMLFLGECFAREAIGLREEDNDVWTIHFGPIRLATLIGSAGNASLIVPQRRRRAPEKVSPMCPV